MMSTFSVRTILRWSPRANQNKKYIYEERITLWNATSLEQAIVLAEQETKVYVEDDAEFLGLSQAYWLFEEIALPSQGVEVYSLLRESDLEPKEYLDSFFDTGFERDTKYKSTPDSAPNGTQQHNRVIRPPKRGRHR